MRNSPVAKIVVPGFVDLDEVGAFLELLANYFDQFVDAVRPRCVGQHMLLGVKAQRILMSTQDVDCVAADTQTRVRE